MKISKVVILINQTKGHARQTAAALKAVLDRERVAQQWVETLPPQRNLYHRLGDLRNLKPDLVIACGGDGTLLQAVHRFRGSGIPILGINIGYLGFITSIPGNRVRHEMKRILNAEFVISERTALALDRQARSFPSIAANASATLCQFPPADSPATYVAIHRGITDSLGKFAYLLETLKVNLLKGGSRVRIAAGVSISLKCSREVRLHFGRSCGQRMGISSKSVESRPRRSSIKLAGWLASLAGNGR